MPAQFSAFPADRAAVAEVLDDAAVYRVGRAADCELRLDHHSVSRLHAEIVHLGGLWQITDTGSKNGLRVDGHLVQHALIERPTWFAIGDVYCWLEPLAIERAESLVAQQHVRRSTSRAMSQQLHKLASVDALLEQTIDAVLELAGMQRGFIVHPDTDGALRMYARRGIDTADFAQKGFGGSAAAVERALTARCSVICCDTSDSPWLGARPSVKLGGIRALAAVPLLLEGEVLGAIYTDSRTQGPLLTELDLELVENVAQNAAAALAAVRLRGAVDALRGAAADLGAVAPRWDEVRGER